MKADGITLSTVGAGGGANPFLEQLAKQGGGRFYAATNPASIPDIFLKETQQVSGQQIVEEPFFPIQTSSLADPARPRRRPARSSSATTARPIKPAAQTVLVTARDDPLLAQWQYGLGRSVAWTSDSTGRWAKDWVGWSGFNRFFSQLVELDVPGRGDRRHRGDLRDDRRHDRAARRERRGGRLAARLLLDQRQRSSGRTSSPRRSTSSRSRRASTRRRSASSTPGAYAVRITQTRPGTSPLGRTVGLVAPTAAEYRLLGANEPFLASLRSATGGGVVATADRPVGPRPDRHEPLHRAVAAAARPRAAALAAGHRAAADVARAARAGRGPRLARRHRSSATGCRPADRDRRGPARRERPGQWQRRASRDAELRRPRRRSSPTPSRLRRDRPRPPPRRRRRRRRTPAPSAPPAPPTPSPPPRRRRPRRRPPAPARRDRHDGPPPRRQAPRPRPLADRRRRSRSTASAGRR